MNKLQFDLVKETLLEYAYKESNGEGATFHKILLVKKNSEITSIIQTELLKKGIYMIMVETIWEAEDKLLECQDIELILCDLFLQDGRCNRLFFYFQKVYKKVLRYAKYFKTFWECIKGDTYGILWVSQNQY